VAGLVFEDIAVKYLEMQGFEVLQRRRRIFINGVEVGEVDIVARRDGTLYAIEVKAGKADITAIRQAYVNAKLLGAKPLIVARGFANDEARELANALGVEIVALPEYVLMSVDEVMGMLVHALEQAAARIASAMVFVVEHRDVVDAIVKCGDAACLCETTDCREVMRLIREELGARSYAEARTLITTALKLINIVEWLLRRR